MILRSKANFRVFRDWWSIYRETGGRRGGMRGFGLAAAFFLDALELGDGAIERTFDGGAVAADELDLNGTLGEDHGEGAIGIDRAWGGAAADDTQGELKLAFEVSRFDGVGALNLPLALRDVMDEDGFLSGGWGVVGGEGGE